MKIVFALVQALLLAACGAGTAPPVAVDAGTVIAKDGGGLSAEVNRRCHSLGGGSATVSFTAGTLCETCTATAAEQAIDGADETAASLDAGPGQPGALTLRSYAQRGVVIPAGSNAALTMSAADSRHLAQVGGISLIQSAQNWHLTIRTYLDDVLQEEDSGNVSLSADPNTRHISGIATSKPFNSIEAVFDRSGLRANAQNPGVDINATDYASSGNALVHEFCADFDLTGLNKLGVR